MGAWIEILTEGGKLQQSIGRTPRWVRGLKFIITEPMYTTIYKSHPTMGAWIEIYHKEYIKKVVGKSHPTMGAWIEIL